MKHGPGTPGWVYNHLEVNRIWGILGICSGSFIDHVLSTPGSLYALCAYALQFQACSSTATAAEQKFSEAFHKASAHGGCAVLHGVGGLYGPDLFENRKAAVKVLESKPTSGFGGPDLSAKHLVARKGLGRLAVQAMMEG